MRQKLQRRQRLPDELRRTLLQLRPFRQCVCRRERLSEDVHCGHDVPDHARRGVRRHQPGGERAERMPVGRVGSAPLSKHERLQHVGGVRRGVLPDLQPRHLHGGELVSHFLLHELGLRHLGGSGVLHFGS